MDSADQKIGHELRRITRTDRVTHTLMSGKVVAGSIDESAMTCSVLLTIDDNTGAGDDADVPTDNVMLNCVSMNNNGFLLYPADNSDVIVGEVDGPGQYALIKCSNLLKAVATVGSSSLTIKDSLIQFNDGSLNGLVKVTEVANKLKTLEQKVNALNNAMKGIKVPLAPSGTYLFTADPNVVALTDVSPLTAQNDIENTKITQG